jgi:DNA helicase-2/ATP-dependent DNA helicase PcrA
MTPSKYQIEIYSAIQNSWDNLIIEAVAGSGKTTTIVEGLKLIPPTKKCLFLAFNKAIAVTLSSRVPAHVEAKTMHSLGWSVIKENVGWFKSNDNKNRNLYYYKVNNLKAMSHAEKKLLYARCNSLCTMISLLKARMVTTYEGFEDNWQDVALKNDIKLPRELSSFKTDLRKTYFYALEQKTVIDFDDMIFLPAITAGWRIPVKYDCIFVDEAQDLSPVQHVFLSKFLKEGGRIIAVGDSSQAIYGFRGASPFSMQELKVAFQMKPLPLSICYRCGSTIVKHAQRLVPTIEPSPFAEAGSMTAIGSQTMLREVKSGDIILCRNVAPLLDLVPKLLELGKTVNYPYQDTMEELGEALEDCRAAQGGTTGLSMTAYCKSAQRQASAASESTLGQPARGSSQYEHLFPILYYFSRMYPNSPITNKHFEEYLNDPSGIFVASVHKAKGLEADRVYVYKPELMPSENAKLDWQLVQERNLEYVAITRARKVLVYVSE